LKKLSLEEGSLALLQTYFDIKEEKVKQNRISRLSSLRGLYLGHSISKLWQKQSAAVIKRVFELVMTLKKKKLIVS
jgi:hypothetical protein